MIQKAGECLGDRCWKYRLIPTTYPTRMPTTTKNAIEVTAGSCIDTPFPISAPIKAPSHVGIRTLPNSIPNVPERLTTITRLVTVSPSTIHAISVRSGMGNLQEIVLLLQIDHLGKAGAHSPV